MSQALESYAFPKNSIIVWSVWITYSLYLLFFFFFWVGERVAGDGSSQDLGLRTNKNQSLLMKVKE